LPGLGDAGVSAVFPGFSCPKRPYFAAVLKPNRAGVRLLFPRSILSSQT